MARKDFVKKVFLKISQIPQESTYAGMWFLIKFQKKETPTQVFSCECCEIFKNICLADNLQATAFKFLIATWHKKTNIVVQPEGWGNLVESEKESLYK